MADPFPAVSGETFVLPEILLAVMYALGEAVFLFAERKQTSESLCGAEADLGISLWSGSRPRNLFVERKHTSEWVPAVRAADEVSKNDEFCMKSDDLRIKTMICV